MRILYILSTPRSGSTLLSQLLGQAPGAFAVGELRYFLDRGFQEDWMCGCGAAFSECAVWSSVVGEIMSEGLTLSPQALLHQGERTRNRLGRRRMNFFNTILHPGYTRPEKIHDRMPQYVAFQEQLYRAVKRVTGCSTIVDNSKDPYYAYILGTIPAVDLKVLHLVRDARAVAHSRVKRRKTQIVTKERSMTMGQRMGMLRSAKDWVLINHVAERLFGRDSTGYFRLRYEDLVRDPGATLGAVADFAGMTAPPSVSGADGEITLAPTHQFSGNPIRVEHGATTIRDPEPWRSDLSRAERFLIHAICGRHQRRYAYA